MLFSGDFCNGKNRVTGICKHLKNCTVAILQIQTGSYPKICGFEGLWPIVCCTSMLPEPSATLSPPPHKRRPGYISKTSIVFLIAC